MKNLIVLLCVCAMSITTIFAQNKKEEKVDIKTSAVCGMCKSTIAKALKKENGVTGSKLDLDTKVLTVSYDPAKTNPDKIRKAVTMAGYDADDMPADKKAYNKLEACCKKGK